MLQQEPLRNIGIDKAYYGFIFGTNIQKPHR